MAEKEATQYTPKGYEIPVPEREAVLDVFRKSAEPIAGKPKKKSRRRKGSASK